MLRAHGVDWKEPSHPSGKCGVCKLAVFCRKVPVLLEKKIDFSDQKIKVMVRGYLPWQPLSIPLSARGEKARWTKPSPVRELRVPPPTHTHKELLRLFIPQRMWELYFLSWNTTEHFFHRMKIPVFGQPESKLLETWGQIFGLYKLASSIVFSPQRIWP